MNCPNCGLANPDSAKFCANCGTHFTSQAPSPGPYQVEGVSRPGNSLAKNIGLGCLIFAVIFLFLGLSCTRACFGHRRAYLYHRY